MPIQMFKPRTLHKNIPIHKHAYLFHLWRMPLSILFQTSGKTLSRICTMPQGDNLKETSKGRLKLHKSRIAQFCRLFYSAHHQFLTCLFGVKWLKISACNYIFLQTRYQSTLASPLPFLEAEIERRKLASGLGRTEPVLAGCHKRDFGLRKIWPHLGLGSRFVIFIANLVHAKLFDTRDFTQLTEALHRGSGSR